MQRNSCEEKRDRLLDYCYSYTFLKHEMAQPTFTHYYLIGVWKTINVVRRYLQHGRHHH